MTPGGEDFNAEARGLLRDMVGDPIADFHVGQLEAIRELVLGSRRLLLVERTGWGKSAVYFIATSMLRGRGEGMTIVISPLLALMRNQIERMGEVGLKAATINSANEDDWKSVTASLAAGECDILFISPERLRNEYFQQKVAPILPTVGMLVVDEAHCISDWGHDFRPEYRRIVSLTNLLSPDVRLLATTATANQRVVDDIALQLGNLRVQRGSLARESLYLQVIRLDDQAERLAWLAREVPHLHGTGIVYCLTIVDAERVAGWLQSKGIDAHAYHGDLEDSDRQELERRLLKNEVKALVATVALGMGFDKPDVGFVIHFQRPGSPVAYYQQVGRAGRGADAAFAILLTGREDDAIQQYFIDTAFPTVEATERVLKVIEESGSVSRSELLAALNMAEGQLNRCVEFLLATGAIAKQQSRLFRTAAPWSADFVDAHRTTAIRAAELATMQEFVSTTGCLMQFIGRKLDDPHASPCGHCANCLDSFFEAGMETARVVEAVTYLRRHGRSIPQRKMWPASGVVEGRSGKISAELRTAPGFALSLWNDPGWGKLVREGKYKYGAFADELVEAAVAAVTTQWQPDPPVEWVTCVPSRKHPELVRSFAQRLANALGVPFRDVVAKIKDTEPQKTMENSVQQARNVGTAFEVRGDVSQGPVLLVDDVVNSRWSITVIGVLLREAGSGPVHPFALAMATATSTDL